MKQQGVNLPPSLYSLLMGGKHCSGLLLVFISAVAVTFSVILSKGRSKTNSWGAALQHTQLLIDR